MFAAFSHTKATRARVLIQHTSYLRSYPPHSVMTEGALRRQPLWPSSGIKQPLRDDSHLILEIITPRHVNRLLWVTWDPLSPYT